MLAYNKKTHLLHQEAYPVIHYLLLAETHRTVMQLSLLQTAAISTAYLCPEN
jgi:hypothetical protein